MNRFLIKTAIFGIIMISLLFTFAYCITHTSRFLNYLKTDYLWGYIQTIEKIKENKDNQKIIFVGGSNLGFGLNTALIQEKTGIFSYNLGSHAGIALKRIIDDIKPYLTEKDLIILSPEYENFDNLVNSQYETIFLDFLNGRYSQLLTKRGLSAYSVFLQRNIFGHFIKPNRDPIYSRSAFNKNGDVISHFNAPTKPFQVKKYKFDASIVNEMVRFIQQNLKTVNFIFVPPVTHEFKLNKSQIHSFDSLLVSALKDKYPIRINQMIYQNECFYDTEYHLNKECNTIRTIFMIDYLNDRFTKKL